MKLIINISILKFKKTNFTASLDRISNKSLKIYLGSTSSKIDGLFFVEK